MSTDAGSPTTPAVSATRLPASLAALPRELVISCLSHCRTPADVVRFSATSHDARACIVDEGEPVWRALAIGLGWTLERTTAETGCDVGARYDPLPGDTGAAELERAIAAQRTLDRPYHGVVTWRDFVEKRWRSEMAWRYGRQTVRAVDIGDRNAFRFKFDTDTQTVVYSSVADAVDAVTLSGEGSHQSIPAPHMSHVELSEGYVCFASSDSSITIFRRTVDADGRPRGPYAHLHTVLLNHNVRAYKARAPILVVAGLMREISVIDLASGLIVYENRFDPHQIVSYVDVDATRLYIAFDDRLTIISRADGRHCGSVALDGPAEGQRFEACHVDLRGRHLVAIAVRANDDERDAGDSGGLILVRDLVTDKTSILLLDQAPRQLSVENGRVVFTTAGDWQGEAMMSQGLFAFDLPSGPDWVAPQIRCLEAAIPSLDLVDGASVYVVGSTLGTDHQDLYNKLYRYASVTSRSVWEHRQQPFAWIDQDTGENIGAAWDERHSDMAVARDGPAGQLDEEDDFHFELLFDRLRGLRSEQIRPTPRTVLLQYAFC